MLTQVVPNATCRLYGRGTRTKAPPIDADHVKQRQVVKARRQYRHAQHLEIRNLEELGNQKSSRAHDRRAQYGAQAARRQ